MKRSALRWVLASALVFAGAGAARAALTLDAVLVSDVTPFGFSVVARASGPVTPTLRVYGDAAGTQELTSDLEITAYPLQGSDPAAADAVSAREAGRALQAAARALGLAKVRVHGCVPATSYWFQLQATNGGETAVFPVSGLSTVVTAGENAFVADSRSLLVSIPAPVSGGTAAGWLVLASSSEVAAPVSALVGDGAAADQAFLNLTRLIGLDGLDWSPSAPKQLDLEIWGAATGPLLQKVTVDFSAAFSVTSVQEVAAAGAGYTVAANAFPLAGGSVAGVGNYAAGATASLTATANDGYRFMGWSGDVTSADNPLDVVVNADVSVTANFVQVFSVAVAASPAAGGAVSGAATYDAGATATLTATANAGYRFTGWSGDAAGTTSPVTVTVNAAKTVTANFVQVFSVAVTASPAAGGAVSGAATYDSGATATLTATANAGYRFTGWSGDAAGTTNPLTVTVDGAKTITANFALRQAPALEPIGPKAVAEGQTLTFTVTGSDTDGYGIFFSIGNKPTDATFDPATGVFSWTPGTGSAGNYPITFTVTDQGVPPLSDYETITVTVGNVDAPPALDPIGPRQVAEGARLSFVVSATDPNGDPITYDAGNLPPGAAFNRSTHTFEWTPASGASGVYYVTFTASSGSPLLTASEVVTITVGNVNRPPVLDPIGAQAIEEGHPFGLTVTGSDPDGDNLIFSASSLPDGATFDPASQTFAWLPAPGTAGNYEVTFTVTDSGTPPGSDSEAVTITVGHVNRPPTLDAIGNKETQENAPLTFGVSGSDPDGGALAFSATPLPAGAGFDPLTRFFAWTPAYDQSGTYKVTFAVADAGSPPLQASEEVTITVGNVDRAPTLGPVGGKTGKVGATLTFALTGSDPDGDALTFSADGLPRGASFDSATRTFSWTPAADQMGKHTVTFSVSDGTLSATEAIDVDVSSADTGGSGDGGGGGGGCFVTALAGSAASPAGVWLVLFGLALARVKGRRRR